MALFWNDQSSILETPLNTGREYALASCRIAKRASEAISDILEMKNSVQTE